MVYQPKIREKLSTIERQLDQEMQEGEINEIRADSIKKSQSD